MIQEEMKRASVEYCEQEQASRSMAVKLEKAFIAGAEWRIKSVWHDMNEKPNFLKLPILLQHKKGQVHFIDATPVYWDSNQKYYTRWAYVSDLLPKKED